MNPNLKLVRVLLAITLGVAGPAVLAQPDTGNVTARRGASVILSGDTLFTLYTQLGPFSPEQRAEGIIQRLDDIVAKSQSPNRIRVVEAEGFSNIVIDSLVIMSVTSEDASLAAKSRAELTKGYVAVIQKAVRQTEETYSLKSILIDVGLTLLFVVTAFLLFWLMRKFFPGAYRKLESWEGTVFRSIRYRSVEIVSAGDVTSFFIVLLKGLRLAIGLTIFYYFVVSVLSFFPWTRSWDAGPILRGLLLSILLTVAAVVTFKSATKLFMALITKVSGQKGILIRAVRVKTVEVLSEDRIVELLRGAIKFTHLVVLLGLAYLYITVLFSFFEFTRTWAGVLIGYTLKPLGNILLSFINYLPNLFFILVLVIVTRFVIKFVRLFFAEVEKGTIALPGFYLEWARPTYKIVRFLIIAFAVIVIFPYLPGSSSDAFRGVSIFLGILFSLGSVSAVANIVAGVVLTYMRPFRLGDRVKIADTIGDVIEKTLLVTRVRTIKNVDVTIPNSMVLGSHIINYSSSAQERGLILHTGVTIGYDAPWRKVHELLIAAAESTQHILKEPKPFVLQTSLDDSYVSYELNAYTDQPNVMTSTYSELHENIQDKFNEAGVEIISPHYSAVRDGNQSTIPEDHLPENYTAPSFRVQLIDTIMGKKGNNREDNKD
jgi:small-conductance mechanosensitive channel